MPIPRRLLYVSAQPCPDSLQELLTRSGWRLVRVTDPKAAARSGHEHRCPVGLAVFSIVNAETIADFEACIRANFQCEWVGLIRPGSLPSPALGELLVNYFFDYHTEPADDRFLSQTLGHAYGRAQLLHDAGLPGTGEDDLGMVGQSPAVARLRRQIRKVGPSDAAVLIGGESGSGKELVALALHRCSARSSGPFVAVNCGALAPTLIHSELFGHEKGSFSGASTTRRGLIESASGGTLFLDEIGELPMELQTTLLRFLQEKTFQRVGAVQTLTADTRVVAASHVDLAEAVAAGRFRDDLFYRLNVVALVVPALRDRPEDIPVLAQHFYERCARMPATTARGLSTAAVAALAAHSWPGNVRELYNRVQRAVVMAEQRMITPEDLGLEASSSPDWGGLQEIRVKAEKSAICLSLGRVRHNVTLAARDLGVSRMTLYRLMAKHSITPGLQ